ncbi:hypothetical protein AAMO2058_000812200 [Amorphochlora amoebiformis]
MLATPVFTAFILAFLAPTCASRPLASQNMRDSFSNSQISARRPSRALVSRPTTMGRSKALALRRSAANKMLIRAEPNAAGQVEKQQQEEKNRLPWWLDVGTQGGALTVPTMTLIFPLSMCYGLQAMGIPFERAGPISSFIYLFGGMMLWTFSYLYRVATKSMTYTQQLKNYEDAVMMKRLEAMSDDEIEEMLIEAQQTAAYMEANLSEEEKRKIMET